MAKITIAELDINVQALITSTSEVKKRIDELKKQQAELTKSGETSSKTFVENAAALKALGAEYTAGVKSITETNKAISDQTNRQQALKMAIDAEVDSIDEARSANKLLNQLRNSANSSTEEGKEEILKLNAALDRNNEFIRQNADEYTKQKINIGNYTNSIREALDNINPLNGGIAGFTERSQAAGGAGNLFKNSLSGAASGMLGLVKASLAFIATPVGAIITVIVVAVVALFNAFKSFQPLVEKVEQGFAALGAVISVIRNTFVSLVNGTKSLSEAFDGLGDSMADAARDAANLKEAQQNLEDALEQQEVQSARTRAEINKLNVQAKDRTKSEEERIKLLEKSEQLERQDFEARKKNSDEALRQAQEEIRINSQLTDAEFAALKRNGVAYKEFAEQKGGNQDEAFAKLSKAILSSIELENEATVNLERNLNKRDKLIADQEAKAEKAAAEENKRQEEARENARKATEAAINESKVQLDIFISNQGIRAKSLQEEIALAEQVRDRKIAILKQEFEAGKLTRSEFQLQQLNEQQTFLKAQADASVQFADQELKNFIDSNRSKLDANKFLSDQLVAQEKQRLNDIAEAEAAAQTARLVAGTINQQQYNEAIRGIDLKFEEDKKALDESKKQADIQKKAEDLENKRAEEDLIFRDNLSIGLARLEEERVQEVANAEKTGANIDLINKKFAAAKIDLENKTRIAQISNAQNAIGAIGELTKGFFGENKLLAAALIGIDTILGVQKAYLSQFVPGDPSSLPRAIFAGVQAGAFGALNAAKVAGVKFEKGGIQEIGGKRHSAGGTKFYGEDGTTFEAEAGEGIGVLNRGAFSAFMDFNNKYSSGGRSSSTFMAGGGIITQAVSNNVAGLNINDILVAMQSMPAPVVTVEDINAKTNEVIRVESGANF